MSALGRPEIGYQAATGAFTALHLSHLRPRERAKALPLVALALIAAGAFGVLVGPSVPWTLIGLALITVLASVLVYGLRLGPPGPLFFVLVFGVAAHVAAVAPEFSAPRFLLALAGGCVFSYLLALTPLLRRRVRREPARPLRVLLPKPEWDAGTRTMIGRAAVVGIVGALVGIAVDPDRAYWIVGSGIAVAGIAIERRVAVSRGLHRTVGTLAGAGLYFVLALVPWAGLALAGLLGTLQFLVELLIVRHYALALTFITPMVLLLTGAATGEIGSGVIAAERIVDTLVGAALGIIATLVLSLRDARRTSPG
ncbi:FUSC family protein [Microbacterium hominis]|uniref:FUSC family protein n=2 Tax=Microbacterium hominis TaxID=162426 RepID=A0A7D4Q3J6_9MICO|nr:FUSC family protein [Microbacterium hominis]